MYYGRRALILAWLGAAALGTALHFLYQWAPSPATALLSPIRESLWEHIKIIFWPYLLCALWLNRGRPGGIRPWLLVMQLLCLVTLALGYGYHIVLGGGALWVDIALYLLVMGLGFWLPGQFSGPFQGVAWALPGVLAILLGALIGLFTLWPPQLLLFADLSGAAVWAQLPC